MGFKIVQTEDDVEKHENKVEGYLSRIEDRRERIVDVKSGQYEARRMSKNQVPYIATIYYTHITWVG